MNEPTSSPFLTDAHAVTVQCRRYDGRVAIVTGAAQGLGRVIALRLALEGASVVLADLQAERVQRTADQLRRDSGRPVIAFVGDLSEPGCADALADTTRDEFGRIDTLVNNAAALVRMPFLDLTEDVMQQAVDGNWWQMVRSTRAVLPTMVEQHYGRIVGIGGGTGVPFHTFLLGVGKGAMLGFTKSLAAEVAHDGITVNVVAPTAFEADNDGDPERTPRTQRPDWTPPDVLTALGAWAAPQRGMGRMAHPSEVAAAVAFIGSPEASFITGHQLDVNGGN